MLLTAEYILSFKGTVRIVLTDNDDTLLADKPRTRLKLEKTSWRGHEYYQKTNMINFEILVASIPAPRMKGGCVEYSGHAPFYLASGRKKRTRKVSDPPGKKWRTRR